MLCFSARPGKVVGPVMPWENANATDAYDPRRYSRNPVLPLQPGVCPAYCFQSTAGRLDNSNRESMADESESICHKPPQPCLPNKVAPEIALNMRASPFYLVGTTKAEPAESHTMEANLLHVNSPYNGIAAGAGSGPHRKVGTIQFGTTRMY